MVLPYGGHLLPYSIHHSLKMGSILTCEMSKQLATYAFK